MKKIFVGLVLALGLGFGVQAQTAVVHKVVLNWAASPSINVTGYNLKRFAGACSSTSLVWATISGANVLTFTDTNVTEGATYCYAVEAVSAGGTSSTAGTLQVVIPISTASAIPLPPGAPVANPVQ